MHATCIAAPLVCATACSAPVRGATAVRALWVLTAIFAFAARPAAAAEEPAPAADVSAADASPDADAAAGSDGADAAAPVDHDPPVVVDVAVAADNPSAAPVVTAMFRDNVGVAEARVHWRTAGQDWSVIVMAGEGGGLRIARLPDGVQRQGFSLWLDARDAAGNVVRVASASDPIAVPPAVEGNRERLEREQAEVEFPPVHPGVVAIALGTGLVAGAASGVFWYDWRLASRRLEEVEGRLASGGLSAGERESLTRTRDALGDAITQDIVFGSIFGVVAVAAVATGVTLSVIGTLEE
jgi:hypothetical protein